MNQTFWGFLAKSVVSVEISELINIKRAKKISFDSKKQLKLSDNKTQTNFFLYKIQRNCLLVIDDSTTIQHKSQQHYIEFKYAFVLVFFFSSFLTYGVWSMNSLHTLIYANDKQ